MNILIVSYYLTYPPNNGASVAQFATLEHLSELCNISLLLPEKHSISDADLQKLEYLYPKVKFYTVNEKKDLKEDNSCIDKYLMPNINFIKKQVYSVLKYLFNLVKGYSRHESSLERFSKDYSVDNRFFLHSPKIINRMLEIIKVDRIDIVQLEHFENVNLVMAVPKYVKKVFLCHESLLSRLTTSINLQQFQSPFASYVYDVNKRIQSAFLKDFNAVLAFTDSDILGLKESAISLDENQKFHSIPFPVFEQDFKKIERATFQLPNKLVFVGGASHFPNRDAVEWFINEMGAEIFSRFGLRLDVIGHWDKKTITRYKNHPSKVNFIGYVNDVYEVSRNSISIAPIRIGAGLKTKVILAMAHGIPVIATDFALDGINAKSLDSVLVANDKDSFCYAIEYLLQDLERTFLICKSAQERARAYYSQAIVAKQRYDFYEALLPAPNELFYQDCQGNISL